MYLSDFEAGIVPFVQWPTLRGDADAIAKIQAWIVEGSLVCPGQAKPDPIFDWLITPAGNNQKKRTDRKKVKLTREQMRQRSWPYQCGAMAAAADKISGAQTENPCIGITGERWQSGYDGVEEQE